MLRASRLMRACLLPLWALVVPATAQAGYVAGHDDFTFTYDLTVPPLRAGQTANIWVPLATNDAFQQVQRHIELSGLSATVSRDSTFNDEVLHITASHADQGKLVRIVYNVVRHEKSAYPAGPVDRALYLRSEPLVPLNGRFKKMAAEITAGKQGDLARGRAIYDYVLKEMKYDKSGKGWGHGDAVYACDMKTGNCTDFHALFIALARSAGIPARFAIGFTIPPQGTAGEIQGYHCWAEFLADGKWVPIDISEAWKEKTLTDYYFGHHPANRFQMSAGRGLKLTPKPHRGPVNFLVYPYIEVNGRFVKAVGTYSFKRTATPDVRS